MDLTFAWDPEKAVSNLRNHRVSFEEASTVFLDDYGLLRDDPDHSEHEDRFLLLGLSQSLRILMVCHCQEESGNVIRLISARKANRRERQQYTRRLKL
jgi:uncharacterized DUF497 family protein